MKPETKFRQNQVLPFLKSLKNSVYFPIQQMGLSGDPDFIGVACGLFVGLELKTDRGKLSPLQDYKRNQIQEKGGIYIVARPLNWEITRRNLQLLDEGICRSNSLTSN